LNGTKTCSITGCTRRHKARGYCSPHYADWFRKTPSCDKTQPSREERFWAKVDKSAGPEGCWHWTATVGENGYGQFHNGTRLVKAHRFAYEISSGPAPEWADVDHTCHNGSGCYVVPCDHRKCVNPRHLEAVTRSVNASRGNCGEHNRKWAA
jgi:hypothetical protein